MTGTDGLEEYLSRIYPKSYAKEAAKAITKGLYDVHGINLDGPKVKDRIYERDYSEF